MREFLTSVSPKGQITLPAEIRKRLGVKPKDKIAIRDTGDEVTLAPATSRLEASYQVIPALDDALSWREVTDRAHEELAQRAAAKDL